LSSGGNFVFQRASTVDRDSLMLACIALSSPVPAARRTHRPAWTLFICGLLSTALFTIPSWAQARGADPLVFLTDIARVHNLAPDHASRARLHLLGTITYYDPSDLVMFLQDATGGVYVKTDKPYPVRAGDLVALDGLANASYRTEVATNPTIRVLGKGHNYSARKYNYQELAAGRGDCKLVAIRGKVRAADVEQHQNAPSLHLDIGMPGGEVQVYLESFAGFRPESMLDDIVDVKGVAGGAFDAKDQLSGVILYVPQPSGIRVVRKPPIKQQQLPLTDIDDVFQSLSTEDRSGRVRVRGTVTYYKKGYSAVLERDGKSIFVQTRETNDLSVGDVVDAFGFPSDREYAPSLRQASMVRTGGREQIAPRAVSYADALSGIYSDNLISMSGVLISQLHDAGSDTLVMDVNGHPVSGSLEQRMPLTTFPIGSRIRLAGICRIVPGGPWRLPYLFHLDMRSAADAQLIAEPSWWTVRHLVEVLGVLLVLAIATAICAILLRIRLIEQTIRIKRSMSVARERSRILELISSNQTPDVLLREICNAVMLLLPGTECSYFFDLAGNLDGQGASQDGKLFEVVLTGTEGRSVGRIVVTARAVAHSLIADREEMYATISELANLAVQQSLLHQSLVHHSTHDALTDLPNRRYCESMFATALEEAERQSINLAVIYIDVNCFKRVNDSYGHKMGDLYLQQISSRLQMTKRSSDMLARIGGDEFLVVAPLTTGVEDAEVLLNRLQACFNEPFFLEGQRIEGSASFGLARYPEHGTTPEALKRIADHAMYISKRNIAGAADSLNNIAIITPSELELALRKDQFHLAYQPQFSANGRLTGLEALIRLEDSILGTLTPDAFISIAERHDVIIDIGKWVLRRALKDAVRWQLHTGDDTMMVVNVAARQIEHPGFAESVMACLKESAFPPQRLELELTERSFVSGREEMARQLQRLRQAGIRISIDDFGTGQSCLSLLHKLPIDTIKIDRSFIVAMDDDPRVLPIIKAISFMARCLGKRVVAEGLEHVGPVSALLRMGKMDFQGYLLSRPIAAAEVDPMIRIWRSGIDMPEAFGGLKNGRRARMHWHQHR
jgi:diguanylate cyclase (GGDEF)-like protein